MKSVRGSVLALIATCLTVAGVAIAWSVLAWKPSEVNQRDALRELGALVSMDGTGKYVASVNCSTMGIDAPLQDAMNVIGTLRAISSLDLSRTAVADEHLETIGRLNSLASLSLSETDIGDVAVGHISHLDNLESLHLSGTNVTDACLPSIASLGSLKILDLSGTSIRGDFKPLEKMPKLEWIVLSRLDLKLGALASLQAVSGLRHVTLKQATFTKAETEVLHNSHPGIAIDE